MCLPLRLLIAPQVVAAPLVLIAGEFHMMLPAQQCEAQKLPILKMLCSPCDAGFQLLLDL